MKTQLFRKLSFFIVLLELYNKHTAKIFTTLEGIFSSKLQGTLQSGQHPSTAPSITRTMDRLTAAATNLFFYFQVCPESVLSESQKPVTNRKEKLSFNPIIGFKSCSLSETPCAILMAPYHLYFLSVFLTSFHQIS